jgi:hypothetical protein
MDRRDGNRGEVEDRLRRLLTFPGSALYLEINREPPFRVTLQPVRSERLFVTIEPNRDERGRFRGGSVSAQTDGGSEQVYVFFIDGTSQLEYVIEVPPAIAHVTLVVNGVAISDARPVNHPGEPETIRAQ